MNNKIIALILAFGGIFVFAGIASADIIMPNTHPIDRCVKIDNLNNFSDIKLIGIINSVVNSGDNVYEIKDACLTKGYKFNTLLIYWTTKDYFNSINLSNLDRNSSLIYNTETSVEPYGGYVDDSNPLIAENITYHIYGFSESTKNRLLVYMSKKVFKYKNGSENVENYDLYGNKLNNQTNEAPCGKDSKGIPCVCVKYEPTPPGCKVSVKYDGQCVIDYKITCENSTNQTIIECQKDEDCREVKCGQGFAHERCINNKCVMLVNKSQCYIFPSSNDSCSQIGLRKDGKFCNFNLIWETQKKENKDCENNFECSSNICVSSKCIS